MLNEYLELAFVVIFIGSCIAGVFYGLYIVMRGIDIMFSSVLESVDKNPEGEGK